MVALSPWKSFSFIAELCQSWRGEERRGESQFYLFVISDESDGLQSYCGQIVGEDSRTIR